MFLCVFEWVYDFFILICECCSVLDLRHNFIDSPGVSAIKSMMCFNLHVTVDLTDNPGICMSLFAAASLTCSFSLIVIYCAYSFACVMSSFALACFLCVAFVQ